MKQNRRDFIKRTSILSSLLFCPINIISFNYKLAYDVIICGGGPSGIAASLSASRSGLRVLLIEMNSQIGGNGISGMVSHWLGGRKNNGEFVNDDIFKEICIEAEKRGVAFLPRISNDIYPPYGWSNAVIHGVPFDPYSMSLFIEEKLLKNNVEILYNTKIINTIVKGNNIESVVINNKSGNFKINSKIFIDCTGDADIAHMSGCTTVKGDENGNMSPGTLIFHVYDVNDKILSDYIHQNRTPRFRQLIKNLKDKGEWKFPVDIFISVKMINSGEYMINTSRLVGIDGTNGKSITNNLIKGRKETFELFLLMKKYFPGFENSKIKSIAPSIGIRETRRIQGPYVMTIDDIYKKHSDIVGYSSYGWDLPDPKKPSHQPMSGYKKPEFIPIPYRILVPDKINNLICAGRCVSVERALLGPFRVTAPCMVMGEAAGKASFMLLKK